MEKKQTIFIDIPCPTTFRNVVAAKNSAYRQLLQQSDAEVILLVPESAYKEVAAETNGRVEVVQAGVRRNRVQSFSDFITKHLNFTGMQYLGSKYGLRYEATKGRKKTYLHTIRWCVAHTFGKWHWFRVSMAPRMHLFAYRERPLKKIFEQYQPDLVFVPNLANPQGEEVLRESKRQHIPTIGLVGSWDHPHKRYQALQTDEIFVWSDSLKDEMIDLQSYPAERVLVVGAPHYDMFFDEDLIMSREELFTELGLDPKKKLISFYSTTGRTPYEDDFVDMVLQWNTQGKLAAPSQIYVRTYPGDPIGDHKKFNKFKNYPEVHLDWLETDRVFGADSKCYFPDETFMKRLISVYYHSDIIMSPYSSVSVEASVFLKPIININFDGYTEKPYRESVKRFVHQSHFAKVTDTAGVVSVESAEDFLSVINTMLLDPEYNKENAEKLRTVLGGRLDGHVGERIAAHIAKRIESIAA